MFIPHHLIVCVFIFTHVHGLRIKQLKVPMSIVNGSSPLVLGCVFDLEGEVLYSVKWYKNYVEFYRFLPSNVPTPAEAIDVKGAAVDVSFFQEIVKRVCEHKTTILVRHELRHHNFLMIL